MEKVLGVIVFVLVPFMIWKTSIDEAEFKEACERKGGQVVSGRNLRICVDPKVIIPLSSPVRSR